MENVNEGERTKEKNGNEMMAREGDTCCYCVNALMGFHKFTNQLIFKSQLDNHRAPLVRWSLHKYECLWGVGGKSRGSSFQEGTSHTYTLRLC